jgi:OFA family oxalate/formate antiporter-like MFS transporter
MAAASQFAVPPAGWAPEGWKPAAAGGARMDLPPSAVLRQASFYLLWVTYFLGTSVGLVTIGEASPLLREAARVSGPAGAWTTAGVGLGIFSVLNGVGRLIWGNLSDRFGRMTALAGMAAVSAIACAGVLRTADGFTATLAGLSLGAFAYGGYLALMPALTADFYGAKNIGANYGMLFSAWGLCGFLVPGYFAGQLDAARRAGDLAGGYERVFATLAGIALASGAASWAALRLSRR